MKKPYSFLLRVLLLGMVPAYGVAEVSAAETGPGVSQAAPEDVAAWRKLKFGLFVHWGPVSLKGSEIGWSRGAERPGLRISGLSGVNQVPVEVYDNLYKKFNPTKFNADQWVEIAKAAGMKYLVFTTKHHDGFCNFNSKLTDYKITSPESPYGRDIVKQLADACHRGDILWGVYYSQPDWHHPDYYTENHDRYIKYLHGQVRELLTRYGKVSMIFFDGLGTPSEKWDAPTLINLCRRLQPRVMINNRTGLPADFDTPEQRIGRMNTRRPWETCMTICRQWAWKPGDKMKSLKQCIDILVRVVGGDGNLLLNVGPMPDGRIEPRQVERLRQIKKHGESIYDTRGGPFLTGKWGASTYRGNTIYVHLLDSSQGIVTLPPIDKEIVSHKVLTGGVAELKQTDESITITLPEDARDEIDTIVVLTLDGPAAEAKPGKLPSDSVAAGKKATASNVFGKMVGQYGPQMAVDDDPATRWATDGGTKEAWLEVDLGEPVTIDRAVIREAYAGRVRRFELLAKDGDAWKTIVQGKQLGQERNLEFPSTTARHVRLAILEATEGPTIFEFQLFAAKR